jgi:hypothetical protein
MTITEFKLKMALERKQRWLETGKLEILSP